MRDSAFRGGAKRTGYFRTKKSAILGKYISPFRYYATPKECGKGCSWILGFLLGDRDGVVTIAVSRMPDIYSGFNVRSPDETFIVSFYWPVSTVIKLEEIAGMMQDRQRRISSRSTGSGHLPPKQKKIANLRRWRYNSLLRYPLIFSPQSSRRWFDLRLAQHLQLWALETSPLGKQHLLCSLPERFHSIISIASHCVWQAETFTTYNKQFLKTSELIFASILFSIM